MKFSICNLGCKVNNYEANWYKQELQKKYQEVPFGELADIFIINSCTVTNVAGSKTRQMMHKARRINPDGVVCVVGCYVQMEYEDNDIFNDVDILVGSSYKTEIPDLIEEFLEKKEKIIKVTDLTDCAFDEMKLDDFDMTRAYLKIQDGCNQFCSYCVIPYARGRERSLNPDKVIEIANSLVANGHKEIVLTGIHTGRYKYEDTDFTKLVKRLLAEVNGLQRLRVSSIEMTEVTSEFIELMKNDDRIAHHLHIPMQTGCDDVLKAMRRPYSTSEYLSKINEIRSQIPDICLSSDVIVGFPNESEEQFMQTKKFIEECQMSFLHVFPYAAKKHTVAADMKGQVSEQIKKQRVSDLTNLSASLYFTYIQKFLGQTGKVLFEKEGSEYSQGHNSQYVMVKVMGENNLTNKMVEVQYDEAKENCLVGHIIRR